MFRICIRFSIVASTLLVLASCLHKQDQLDAKINDQSKYTAELEDRVKSLEKGLKAKQDLFEDLEKRIKTERADNQVLLQDMRVEIQSVRGELEELRHTIEKVRIDLDGTKADMQEKAISSAGAEDDITVYDRTLKIILEQKDYLLAIEKFNEFGKRFPKSSLADNAAYWVGEGYYALGQYRQAILEFQKVIDKFPKSDKVCGTLLKQAYSFEKLNDKAKAKLFLEEIASSCKGKPEAKTAKKHLASLK